jgi:type IX secretion system PorP/SprF family membrane protein
MGRTGFQATYAYHIYVRDVQYSAGISLSAFQFKANVTGDDLYDGRDPSLDAIQPGYSPDANVGFLMSGDNFYGGISATNLFQNALQFGGGSSETAYKLLRHYYVVGGYKYQERRADYGFEPSVMLTFTERLSWSVDLNVKAYYKEDYWAGISFRTSGAVVTMFGMNYQNFYFGYAFDYSFGQINTISRMGSHEIMLGMRLGDSARRYRWLNRF